MENPFIMKGQSTFKTGTYEPEIQVTPHKVNNKLVVTIEMDAGNCLTSNLKFNTLGHKANKITITEYEGGK